MGGATEDLGCTDAQGPTFRVCGELSSRWRGQWGLGADGRASWSLEEGMEAELGPPVAGLQGSSDWGPVQCGGLPEGSPLPSSG